MAKDQDQVHPIDVHVGAMIRLRRKELHISQSELASEIGITFQQIQKYEKGSNRVSASKIFHIAKVLRVQIAYFFEGYQAEHAQFLPSTNESTVNGFLLTEEGRELAQYFPMITRPKLKRRVLDMVRTLAENEDVD